MKCIAWMSKIRRAFTLVETLVALGLAALLLVGFLWLLLPTLNIVATGSARTEAQQQALFALDKMERALRAATVGSVQIFPQSSWSSGEPPGLCFTPMLDVDGAGYVRWDPRLECYWWDRAGSRLMTKTWPPQPPAAVTQDPTPSRAARLLASDFLALVNSTNGTERGLANGVVNFDVEGGPGPALVPPLRISLELMREEGHAKERFKFARVITLHVQ